MSRPCPSPAPDDEPESEPAYRVPGLERGLDVLELLAARRRPMTQAEIARALDRSPSDLFRTLTVLDRRRYLRRDPVSGAYQPTLRLFELVQVHHPEESLLRAAGPAMRALAAATGESCHLAVLDRDTGSLVVLAQAESPARVRLSVAVGSTLPPESSASGRVLLAALLDHDQAALGQILASLPAAERAPLRARLETVRERGWEDALGETVAGVSDLSVPIAPDAPVTRAALAVAALPRDHEAWRDATLPALRATAAEIARDAGLANLPTPD